MYHDANIYLERKYDKFKTLSWWYSLNSGESQRDEQKWLIPR
jgi:hypothetical protein